MRRLIVMLALLAGSSLPLAAQEETPPDSARAESLRQEVETRFAQRVKEELGLTDDQAQRMQRVARTTFQKRRQLEREGMALRREAADQLRPGIAADTDRLNKVLDRLVQLRIDYAQTYRDENKELAAFLTPVQRGQYFMMRERLFDQVRRYQQMRGGPRQPPALDRP